MRAQQVSAPEGNAANPSLTLHATSSTDLETIETDGEVALPSAQVNRDAISPLLAGLSLPSPFTAHERALKAAILSASDGFQTGMGFNVIRAPDEALKVTLDKAVSLSSESGLTISASPEGDLPLLFWSDGQTNGAGVLSLSGGGAPMLDVRINEYALTPDGFSVAGDAADLKSWRAERLAIGTRLSEFSASRSEGVTHASAIGEVMVDGPLFGVSFRPTRIFGGVEAVLGEEGARLQTYQRDCLGIDSKGLDLNSSMAIKPTILKLCPTDGRFLRQSGDIYSGKLNFTEINLPFAGADTSGDITLTDGSLSWSAADARDKWKGAEPADADR